MTIAIKDFRKFVVEPATKICASAGIPDTEFARDLLVATAAQESNLGTYLHQQGAGPALGVFQIERRSLQDLFDGFISRQGKLAGLISAISIPATFPADQIIFDLRFAAVIARLFYFRVREPMPTQVTMDNLWHYYKTHYNTGAGAATRGTFETAVKKLTDIRVP